MAELSERPLTACSSQRPLPPSLLDSWALGDAWIAVCASGRCLVLYVNNRPVRFLAGVPFDQPALNSRLAELRTRPPRGMSA